jgi:hypothetical protein
LKQQILTYLIDHYNKTKWPFFIQVELRNTFGNDVATHLNELREEGYIRRAEGPNCPLVELIKFE